MTEPRLQAQPGSLSLHTFRFLSYILSHVLMYKILEADGKTCAGFICALLIVAMKLDIMALSRYSIDTCRKSKL